MGDNGAGKTTIFSALTWCLYGRTLKKKSSPEPYKFVRGKKFKGTLVVVSCEIDGTPYEIYRTYKYKSDIGFGANSTLIGVKRDGQWEKGIRDINDGKAYVEKLIGHSYELFVNTILFGQKLKRLVQETGPNRNKILEEAFDVTFIRDGLKITSEKLKALETEDAKYLSELESLVKDINHIEETITDKKRTLNDLKTNLERLKIEQRKVKRSQIYTLREKIKTYREEEKVYKIRVEKYGPYENLYNKTKSLIFKKEMEIENLKGDIEDALKDLQDSKPDRKQKKCPTCGTIFKPVTGQRYKDIVEVWRRKLDRAKEHQRNLKGTLEIKKKELEGLKNESQEHKSRIEKYNESLTKIKMLEAERNKAEKELKELKSKKKITGLRGIKKMIEELQTEINSQLTLNLNLKKTNHKVTLEEYQKFKVKHQAYLWVGREALSNKGLKAYVFHEKIKYLNRILEDYAEYLGYQIIFSVNIESKSKEFKTKIYRNTQLRDYDDLSGGQQQLVDVGTAFGFQELKEASFECNLLILDEIFEHLSAKNIEIVNQLIMVKAQTKSVHLITHLSDFNTSAAEVVTLRLNKKEQTEIVNA
jgi:DNA repair exonuclease SbcCD ATPase subunit